MSRNPHEIAAVAAVMLLGMIAHASARAAPGDAGPSSEVKAAPREETPVAMAPLFAEEPVGLPVTESGLGALHWAARHPGHAWRILLPVEPGDAAERLRPTPSR